MSIDLLRSGAPIDAKVRRYVAEMLDEDGSTPAKLVCRKRVAKAKDKPTSNDSIMRHMGKIVIGQEIQNTIDAGEKHAVAIARAKEQHDISTSTANAYLALAREFNALTDDLE